MPVPVMENASNGDTLLANGTTEHSYHHSYDPTQRPLHVLVAGAGPSGIALAIELLKLPNITFEIFEKNHDVGGTWLENRYLGAACDVASHAYQYTFASNPDWSSHFSPAEEIWHYFKGVAKRFGVLNHVQYRNRVAAARWDEQRSKWELDIFVGDSATKQELKKVEGDLFINAGGILNDWKWPDIQGLHSFEGRLLHTAKWDPSWNWENSSVAVIGSGATSIQVVPGLQPKAKHIDVYVRSPTYILPTVGFGIESSTYNEPYLESEKARFRTDQAGYIKFRKAIEQQMNENFVASIKGSQAQVDGRKWAEKMMRQTIKSPKLQEKLIPSWELGCRRITPGMPYLQAIQKDNVNVIRTGIQSIVKNGIVTADGMLHEVDTIVCATGFNASFSASYDIRGRHEQNLRTLWTTSVPQGYMGLAVSGFPNYFTMLGPNCPIANGSLIPCIESSVSYVCQIIVKMQADQIRTLDVKEPIQTAFNEYVQTVHKDLVWSGSCRSWYKDNVTGKVVAVWPGSSIHYMEIVKTPRWEDYEISYCKSNPFAFMGNGISRIEAEGGDLTYYLNDIGVSAPMAHIKCESVARPKSNITEITMYEHAAVTA